MITEIRKSDLPSRVWDFARMEGPPVLPVSVAGGISAAGVARHDRLGLTVLTIIMFDVEAEAPITLFPTLEWTTEAKPRCEAALLKARRNLVREGDRVPWFSGAKR